MAKIYVTGDTHRHIDIGKVIRFEIRNPDENDYVIVAGDFGLVWNNDREEIYLRNYLTNNKEFTTLFVDGNHENSSSLNQYPITEWNGGKVHTCPVSVQAQLIRSTLDNSLEKYLEEIYKKVKFKKWYFGHYHIDLVMDNNFIALYDKITEMK